MTLSIITSCIPASWFGCPRWVVNILVDWYSKLAVAVRWNGSMSQSFAVRSGVRQGSSLSPSLFNIFVNKFIVESRAAGLGICINKSWLGCIMYADDIILLSASIVGLQALLDKCGVVSSQLGLSFNCSKSWCLAIGPRCKASLPDMFLCHKKVVWAEQVKYLGVTFCAGNKLSCDADSIMRKFYAACNNIFSNSLGLSELMQLHLQQTYSLPVLRYGTVALRFSQSQLCKLNACWNNVYRKVFGFHLWESVREFVVGLGSLDFKSMRVIAIFKLLKDMITIDNSTLNMLSLIFSYGSEFNFMAKGFGLSVKDNMSYIRSRVHNAYASGGALV